MEKAGAEDFKPENKNLEFQQYSSEMCTCRHVSATYRQGTLLLLHLRHLQAMSVITAASLFIAAVFEL